MSYVDIISPESEEHLIPMVERAFSLGYGTIGVIGDFSEMPEGTFRVSVVRASDIPERARRKRRSVKLLLSAPRNLGEARKVTFSKLVDGVIASYDTKRPNFDLVCARQLKRNEGSLIIPVSLIIRKMFQEPRIIGNIRLEVRIALKAGVYPLLVSMASIPREVVPPRLLISFGEYILDLDRGQAKAMVKDFPSYLISEERKLRVKGVLP